MQLLENIAPFILITFGFILTFQLPFMDLTNSMAQEDDFEYLGDPQVLVDIALVPAQTNSTHVLHAKIAVPEIKPLVRTFPSAREEEL